MTVLRIGLAAAFASAAVPAAADSDGYYCATPAYLVYARLSCGPERVG
jgi:hypothetical protein